MLVRSKRNCHRYIEFIGNKIRLIQNHEKDPPAILDGLSSFVRDSLLLTALTLATLSMASVAYADLPTGIHTISGTAGSTSDGNTLNITASNKAIINYQSFNIGSGNTVNIFSPLSLHRVVGGNPSNILGRLNSTGKIFLVNPNGIIFGQGAQVNVQGLVASTLQIKDDDFLAGKYSFQSTSGLQAGSIINNGQVVATESIAFLSGAIQNTGLVQAPVVRLAVGDQVTYYACPEVGIDIVVGESLKKKVDSLQSAITNTGSIKGQNISIQAKLAEAFYATTVNNEGVVQATGLSVDATGKIITIGSTDDHQALVHNTGRMYADGNSLSVNGGKIHFEGDTTINTGTLSAKSADTGVGGEIAMLGTTVQNRGYGKVLADGDYDGGVILIGGDYQGQNGDIRNALYNLATDQVLFSANAVSRGNGGKVILWADDKTTFLANIQARGGLLSGNGGFVETSGKQILQALGEVNSSAYQGQNGQWLLDPNNITIQGTGSDANITGSSGSYSTSNDSAIVTASTIQSALNNGTNVTIQTTSAGANTQIGNINIASGTQITKSSGGDATLTLKAHNSILFNGTSGLGNGISLSSTNNKLNLILNSDTDQGADSGVGGAIRLNYTNLTTNGGSVIIGGGSDPLNMAAMGGSSPKTAISLSASTLTTGAGDVSMRGIGFSQTGAGGLVGINLDTGSVVTTTSGKISLYGTGGAGGSSNYGVCLTDAGTLMTSSSGDIAIWGKAGNGTGTLNIGTVLQNGAYVTSTGTGKINMTGIGGTGTASDHGIKFTGSGTDTGISSVDGNIILNGTGSTAGNGIFLQSGGKIASSGNATISLTGVTGTGADAMSGIRLDGAQIVSNAGAIAVSGTSQTGTSYTDGNGVTLTNASKITNTGTASITVTGTGNAGTSNNMGISLTSANTAISTKDAPIVLMGNGGSAATSTTNIGVQIGFGAKVVSDGTTNNGTISVQGSGGSGTSANYGINITGTGSAINSANGNINIVGMGGNGNSSSNAGIVLGSNGTIASTGNASITVQGTGAGATTTNSNFGVYLNGGNTLGALSTPAISSVSGAINITGTGGAGTAGSNYGVYLKNGGQVVSSGSAPISITGVGGNGTSTNHGVAVDSTLSTSLITNVSGLTAINGTGKGNGTDNHGLYLVGGSQIGSAGSGSLLLTGVAGNGASSTGIYSSTGNNSLGSNGMTGNITLQTDKYSLTNLALRTAGALRVRPSSNSISMGINGGAGVLQTGNDVLSLLDQSTVAPSKVMFGYSSSASALTTVGSSWNTSTYNVPIEVYGGSILTGSVNTGSKSLLMNALTGDLTLASGSVLNSSATGNAITLVASQNFLNNTTLDSGLTTPNGRWLVYSTNPATTMEGFTSYTKRYNRNYSANPPSSLTETGNLFLYSVAPVLTITTDNVSKKYGSANPSFTSSITNGLIDSDMASSAYTGSPTYITSATTSSDVGTYGVTPTLGSLASTLGYSFTYAPGTLTVNPAALTVTANNATKTYGSANPALSASYSGFVLGQDESILNGSLSLTTPATNNSNVGGYLITPSGLSSSNYSITNATGNLSITPAALTVTANNATKLYGSANPAFNVSYSGFVLGQNSSVLNGSLSLTTPALTTSNVGTYAIFPSGLTNNNYQINNAAGLLTINPALLSVTANNISRQLGMPNPNLTATYSGFVLGQDESLLNGTLSLSTAADVNSGVGNYTVAANGTLGTPNYQISYHNGLLTVYNNNSHVAPASFQDSIANAISSAQIPYILSSTQSPNTLLGANTQILQSFEPFLVKNDNEKHKNNAPLSPEQILAPNTEVEESLKNFSLPPEGLIPKLLSRTRIPFPR